MIAQKQKRKIAVGQTDYAAIIVLAIAVVPYLLYAAPAWSLRQWIALIIFLPPAIMVVYGRLKETLIALGLVGHI